VCAATTLKTLFIATALAAFSAASVAPIVRPARAQTQTQTANAVSIENFTFNPPTLRVKVGTKVTWTNKDDIPHGIASSNNAFTRSNPLDTNDSFSFTFAKPGTYKYFCYIHPMMVGTIVVEQATGSNARP